jgi:hypothetical protein
MVSLNGVCSGSLVVSVPGIIHSAQLEGPSVTGIYHMVHFRVESIFGYKVCEYSLMLELVPGSLCSGLPDGSQLLVSAGGELQS